MPETITLHNERCPDDAEHVKGNYWLCPGCHKPHGWSRGQCIECLLDAVPWKDGDRVRIKETGQIGRVVYRYYNGFTCVQLRGRPIKGGAFSNNSTYANGELELATAP